MFTHSELEAMLFLLFIIIAVFGIVIPYTKIVYVDSDKRSLTLARLKDEHIFNAEFDSAMESNTLQLEMYQESLQMCDNWIDEELASENPDEDLLRMYRSERYSILHSIKNCLDEGVKI